MISLVNNTPELLGGSEKRNKRNQNILGENEAKIEQRVHLCCSESDCFDASEVAKPHPN